MSAAREAKIKKLEKNKKVGEKIEYIPEVSGILPVAVYCVVAAISFICGRVFYDKIYMLMLTNLLSMWMMVDIARVLIYTQDFCILITNKRIYGMIGQREISIYYRDVKQIHYGKKGIYIDGGNPHDSILLRFIREKDKAYQVISCLVKAEMEDNHEIQKEDNSLLLSQYRTKSDRRL